MKKVLLLSIIIGYVGICMSCSAQENQMGQLLSRNRENAAEISEQQQVDRQEKQKDLVPQDKIRDSQKKKDTHAPKARNQKKENNGREKTSEVPEHIKGLYVSADTVKNQKKWNDLLQLVEETELNAMVIDIKDDQGHLTYAFQLPLVQEIGSSHHPPVQNLPEMLKTLHEKNIYTIARMVVFKDPYLAQKKQEWAIKHRHGGLWRDRQGVLWIDPYQPEVWKYVVSIAEEAVHLGFDEIQFDYIRFPDSPHKLHKEAVFPLAQGRSKDQVIGEFLTYARKELGEQNAFLSADVFGLTTTAVDDMGIGQKWEIISQHVDVISPMMYPSHYAHGSYGLRDPEKSPHQIIEEGLKDALEKNKKLMAQGKEAAKIRPWYQDFDYHQNYGVQEVKAQIKAGEELGVKDFLLWNQANRYTPLK